MSESYDTGKQGEQAAADYLSSNGYNIIDRNWHCGKYEIDIICKRQDEIIFVEVKSHHKSNIFDIKLLVNKEKRRKIIYSADKYVRIKNIKLNARFDIIVVIYNASDYVIEHIPNAFYYSRY
ncbi:MAG: YraN family protein [Bacteroidales bacterium]|jgi:putative endonuclease|nr:YraN family protein [Bacteroidales bacterium]MDD3915168.1 YraN family protein [Bacteroidales bacterium]MDD4634924.1 YraN family protein [Bacteroidales bacterium]